MKAKAKTTRRIVLLVLITFVLIGGLAGAYAFRKWQRNRRALAQRVAGVEAFQNGRYVDAMRDLQGYLRRYNDDLEALDMLAKARLEVPEPQNRHLPQAMGVLRRILDLDPDRDAARRKLLELYTLTGLNTETLSLADSVLADDPKDLDALRAKTIALARLRRFEDALPVAASYIALKPADLEMQTLLFDAEFQVDRKADALVTRAKELREKEPNDPRWELLQAYAYRYANDRENVVRWLKAAASRTPPDDNFVLILVRLLDESQLFSESLAILETVADRSDNAAIKKEFVWRLWEQNRWNDVIERLVGLDPTAGDTDVGLLALQAMSLYQLQKRDEAGKVVDALAAREKDPTAVAWASVLRTVQTATPQPPARVLEVCRAALEKDPGNAFFEYVLGNAYAQMGERDVAATYWLRTASRRPVWVMPRLRLAQSQLASGQYGEALRAARAAMVLAPNSVEAAVVWALARAANLTGSRTDSEEKLLQVVDEILRISPEEERLIPLRISLLANIGKRDDAVAAFEAALAREKPLGQAAIMQLEQTSRALQLGLEDACGKRAEELYGSTPELALARALRRSAEGKAEDGLRLLDDHARSHATKDALRWRLVRARYLDAIEDPRAKAEWIALVDQYRKADQVQRLALRSPTVQSNKELADRVIERLRTLSGDQGVTWRLERARWLLRHGDSEGDVSKAAAMLEDILADAPTLLDARLLLASSLVRLGYAGRAIRELETVVRARPQSANLALELARLYQSEKDFDAAGKQLERVLQSTTASAEARTRAAVMLASQGDDEKATTELESLDAADGTADPNRDVLLARLYWRRNQKDKLEAICRKLTAAPTAAGVRFLAMYHASQGRTEEAERALALLDGLDLPPGSRESVLADYYAQFAGPDKVVEQYRAAATAAPKDPILWYRLIIAHVLLGQGDEAVKAADEALEAVPDDAAVRFFRQHAQQVKRSAGNARLRPLIAALVRNQPDRSIAAEALKIVADAERNNQAIGDVAYKIKQLADKDPNFLPIQDLLVSVYLRAGRNDDAAQVAARAMRAFPDAVEPAWLAAEALARANRWEEALEVAQQWRRRAAAQPIQADLMIAEARTQLGDPQAAVQQLKPYLERALQNPDDYLQVIVHYARTLIADGKIQEAAALLAPLLEKSPQWRQASMRLAILAIDDPQLSAQWLQRVGSKIPADSARERLALAEHWFALSVRFDKPEYRKTARKILDEVVKDPALAAEAWMAKGLIAERDDDPQYVEKCYRAALKLNPKLHVALNNLAMVLVDTSGNLSDALSFSQQAVALVPTSPNYLDTLAQVDAAMHDYDRAIANLRKAIELEPQESAWPIRLEKILRQAGPEHQEEADRLQQEIEDRFPRRQAAAQPNRRALVRRSRADGRA